MAKTWLWTWSRSVPLMVARRPRGSLLGHWSSFPSRQYPRPLMRLTVLPAMVACLVIAVACRYEAPSAESRPIGVQEAQRFELAFRVLTEDRTRLEVESQLCPGAFRPLSPSPSNALRDGLRLEQFPAGSRRQDDAIRRTRQQVGTEVAGAAQALASADWFFRRAASTQDASFCGRAQSSLQTVDAHLVLARGLVEAARGGAQ